MVQNLRVPSDLAAAIAPAPIVVSPDTTVATAIATLQPSTCPTTPQHRSCVVVSQGQVVGLVTAEDLLGLALTQTSLGSLPLGQVISPGVVT
ncbi:MAG: CBS domain-containing protein, partial [Cyanobacteria bacterium]|nr:CBS domain-containing protein [Cyanobacteriota bacterium]